MAQLMLAKQATFDKPAENRHMRPLYLRGYVNGKPLTKMFVDGGATVNVMPYTTFRKLGMGLGDLTPTNIVLNDFAGNPSDTCHTRFSVENRSHMCARITISHI
jgi:hypothetical protein